jgi:hypothetical protein
MVVRQDGKERLIAGPESFTAKALQTPSVPAKDPAALAAFQKKAAQLQRAVLASYDVVRDAKARINAMQAALLQTAGVTAELHARTARIEEQLTAIQRALTGDETISRRNENPPPTIDGRLEAVVGSFLSSTAGPTGTQLKAFDIVSEEFAAQLTTLKKVVEEEVPEIEKAMDAAGAPYRSGRMPDWKR